MLADLQGTNAMTPSPKRHLLLVHRAFCTPRQSGGTRHYELLQTALKNGWRATVLTSDVNYQTGLADSAEPVSIGRQASPTSENALRIMTVPTGSRLHGGFWRRIVCFLSFCLGAWRLGRKISDPLRFTPESSPCGGPFVPVDLVMGTSPDLFQAFVAWRLAARLRVPFILEIRDLWPDFAVRMGVLKNPLLIFAARQLSRFLLRRAAVVIVNSPAYVAAVQGQGVAVGEIVQVDNGVDVDAYSPDIDGTAMRDAFGIAPEKFVVLYAGALGPANDVSTLLRAAKKLENDSSIQLVIAGDGQARSALEREAAALCLRHVLFTGSLPREDMPHLLAAADACVATLLPVFDSTYPNKVFDAMAAGKPLLLAMNGPARLVVEKEQCGFAVTPSDDEALAAAILRLKNDTALRGKYARNARRVACERFDRRKQAQIFVQTLDRVSMGASPASALRYRVCKRSMDILLSLSLIVLMLPLMVLVAVLVYCGLGRPVLFRQERAGLAEQPFCLFKFRTMSNRYDASGNLASDGERLSALGRFLRKTSLDELPELFLVLIGKMSMVGPRPLPVEYLSRYATWQRVRHSVLPGLTGLAQVCGRNSTTWTQRFLYDAAYVRQRSLWLDLRILCRTVVVVLRGAFSGQGIDIVMPEFMGQQDTVEQKHEMPADENNVDMM